MELKQDCVRYVLLSLEDQGFGMTRHPVTDTEIADKLFNDIYSKDDIFYTLMLLDNGGFIIAKPMSQKLSLGLLVSSLSWSGHELLDSIRDEEVWTQTRKATSGLKSVSIGILKNVSSAVLTAIIKQQTGLPL